MAAYKTREIRSALEKKGFCVKQGRNHEVWKLCDNGMVTPISTILSRGNREYGDPLLSQVAKQLALPKKSLDELIDCKLGYDDYVALLKQNGRI